MRARCNFLFAGAVAIQNVPPACAGPIYKDACSLYVPAIMFVLDEEKAPVRLFFSVFPDPETAAQISRIAWGLRRPQGLKGRPLLTSRFHCSLYGFEQRGGPSPSLVAKAGEAANLIAVAPFKLSFNSVRSFSGRAGNHPLVLVGDDGVIGLMRLYSSLCTALRKVGLKSRECSSFTPHLTLLYDNRCISEQSVEPISWTVREIVLVLSLVGKTKYVPLKRWLLADNSAQPTASGSWSAASCSP